jgi:hypothetical protein
MATQVQVPGLDGDLTEMDLEHSRQLYNSLPSDEARPDIEHVLHHFAEIFVRNNAHKVFGVHLIHGHFQIPPKNVMFGCQTIPRVRWMGCTKMETLSLDKLHGHRFALTDNGFQPYEYHSGGPPEMGKVNNNFLPELADFINTNGLRNVIALEVLDRPLPEVMTEIVLGDRGTIMIEPERLSGTNSYRQTGWTFTDFNGEPHVCKEGTQVHVTGPKGHIIIVTPRDNTRIETSAEALDTLRQHGYLK